MEIPTTPQPLPPTNQRPSPPPISSISLQTLYASRLHQRIFIFCAVSFMCILMVIITWLITHNNALVVVNQQFGPYVIIDSVTISHPLGGYIMLREFGSDANSPVVGTSAYLSFGKHAYIGIPIIDPVGDYPAKKTLQPGDAVYATLYSDTGSKKGSFTKENFLLRDIWGTVVVKRFYVL